MTDDSNVTDQEKDSIETKLAEFAVYIKKSEPFLKKLKDDLALYLSKKQIVMQAYAGSADLLEKYEQNNLAFYNDNQA